MHGEALFVRLSISPLLMAMACFVPLHFLGALAIVQFPVGADADGHADPRKRSTHDRNQLAHEAFVMKSDGVVEDVAVKKARGGNEAVHSERLMRSAKRASSLETRTSTYSAGTLEGTAVKEAVHSKGLVRSAKQKTTRSHATTSFGADGAVKGVHMSATPDDTASVAAMTSFHNSEPEFKSTGDLAKANQWHQTEKWATNGIKANATTPSWSQIVMNKRLLVRIIVILSLAMVCMLIAKCLFNCCYALAPFLHRAIEHFRHRTRQVEHRINVAVDELWGAWHGRGTIYGD